MKNFTAGDALWYSKLYQSVKGKLIRFFYLTGLFYCLERTAPSVHLKCRQASMWIDKNISKSIWQDRLFVVMIFAHEYETADVFWKASSIEPGILA